MLLCALFASSMAFPVMIWRTAAEYGEFTEKLEPVSILLLKAPFLQEEKIENYPIDGILQQFSYDTSKPYLVKSVLDIYESHPSSFTATYKCDKDATFSPPECLLPNGHLVFNFTYADKGSRKPLGEILFDYAFVPNKDANLDIIHKPSNQSGYKVIDGSNQQNIIITDCNPFTHDLTDGWRLAYYKITSTNEDGSFKEGDPVYASSPWVSCTTPRPWYKQGSAPVC